MNSTDAAKAPEPAPQPVIAAFPFPLGIDLRAREICYIRRVNQEPDITEQRGLSR